MNYTTVGYRTFYGDRETILRAIRFAESRKIYAGSCTSLRGLSKMNIIGNGYDVAAVMEHCGGYDALIRPVDAHDAPHLPDTWRDELNISESYADYQQQFSANKQVAVNQ